jgi:hypothetical protein
MQLNLLPTIQQAISNLLTVYEPEFLRFGYSLFLAFATIIISWQGIRMMFSHDGLGDQMFEFAKLLLFVAFGYAMITFYEAPIPGFGVSFSNLITDQAFYFQSVLEARSFDNIYRHLDELADHFMQPDAWSILANLLYWTVLLWVAAAKALALAVIAFGLIASAVCALGGGAGRCLAASAAPVASAPADLPALGTRPSTGVIEESAKSTVVHIHAQEAIANSRVHPSLSGEMVEEANASAATKILEDKAAGHAAAEEPAEGHPAVDQPAEAQATAGQPV